MDLVKKGVGLAGKYVLNTANAYTGGLAGKILNDSTNWLNKGKTISEVGSELNSLGHWLLNDKGRQGLSNLADKALTIMPNGKIKNILSKINDVAQGRPLPPKRPRKKKGAKKAKKSFLQQRQELDDRIQQRYDAAQQREQDRLNSINQGEIY